MGIDSKRVIAIVTTVAVVGMAVYGVKKYYDSKKQDEQSISLDEAKEIVGVGREVLNSDQIEDIVDESRDTAGYNSSFTEPKSDVNMNDIREDSAADAYPKLSSYNVVGIRPDELAAAKEEEEEELEEAFYERDDPQEVQDARGFYSEDEDVIDELRYEPNSSEAREQFINMELVVLGRNNDTRDIIAMLYDHPFTPMCDEDENLKVRLADHRIKFFGMKSRWIKAITFGDVIMYYAKSAQYHCGNDIRYWVDYFLTCANIKDITMTSDEFEDVIRVLNTHNFFNEELQTHGLFGLSSTQMTEAIVVSRKRIDSQMTYDIEYGQFIQGVTMGN